MRRAFALFVLGVVLAACVESDPSTVDVGPPTTTVAPAPPGNGLPSAGGATSVPPTRRTIVVGGTGALPGQPGASPPSTPVRRDAGGPGSIADVILRPSGAPRLAVQVLTEAGAEPRQATLDRLVAVLREASGKTVSTLGGTVTGRPTWSAEAVRDAAGPPPTGLPAGTLVLRYLFVHGSSDGGPDVLGTSVAGDVAAVFVDRVAASATGLVGPSTIERAVATHELGHLLGLVDLFRNTGRSDPDHPGHSTDTRSVMYWAVESSLVGDLLSGGPPQDFDDADRADLAAIRRG